MNKTEHTPGPWEYVPSTEHHGPYVTSAFGSTICDCYLMSLPDDLSVRNGGKSKPMPFLHEMADPNARLIGQSPSMAALIRKLDAWWTAEWPSGPVKDEGIVHLTDETIDLWTEIRAIIAKVDGQS